MKLVVVSHTPHYRDGSGVSGWGATVREIDRLASLFDQILHVAPLHAGPAPGEALPYRADNVRLVAVEPSGGRSLAAKAGILGAAPSYLAAIRGALADADAVHVRLPSNIGALALLTLDRLGAPPARWYKYAGNWAPRTSEPTSFRFQRWLLRRTAPPAVVTVNGDWPSLAPHVVPFANPCLSADELAAAAQTARGKRLDRNPRILFVGRLEREKGIGEMVAVARLLLGEGGEPWIEGLEVDLVGDGTERPLVESLAREAPDRVRLHGWIRRSRLDELYRDAHVLLHPSHSEGWPKVLGEAMAHGAVPVATDISCLRRTLARGPAGVTVTPGDVEALASSVRDLLTDSGRWRRYSEAAVRLASDFTYEVYLERVRELFARSWDLRLRSPGDRERPEGDGGA